MPDRSRDQRRLRLRRLIASAVATLYLCGSEGPTLLALAAPGWYARPGAGVSSQPLGVSSFDAPGFGELGQAVNLANGNVYASAGGLSYNNRARTGDETTNRIGGSGWNLTSRLRLNGFSRTSNANFGTDNLTVSQDFAGDDYIGYYSKPNILPVNRFARPTTDTGCSTQQTPASASGVVYDRGYAMPNDTYRVSVDLRADANVTLAYGMSDFKTTNANVTTTWQRFTADFTLTYTENYGAQSARVFQVRENVANNPAWEVANISVRRVIDANTLGDNMVWDQDTRAARWSDYCVRPPTTVFARLLKADYPTTPALNASGLIRRDAFAPGTYTVSLEARTRDGTLPVRFGVNDSYLSANKTLTTTWQTLSQTFNATIDQSNAIFEVFEQTANNPAWEIRNVNVQRIAPGSFTLSSGDGSSRVFTQTTPTFSSAPSWIARYQGTTGTTYYSLQPQKGTQFNREWIVLRQTGSTYIAHYYAGDGSRATFNNDGEYADYTQTLHQQYRGAAATTPDPEGTAATTPKTEITYTAANSGLVSKVKDEWGRVTTYEWNTTDKTLTRINELLRTETDNTSYARRTEFEYSNCFAFVCGNQRAITRVTYTAPDGRGAMVSRKTEFNYAWRANTTRLALERTRRFVLANQGYVDTIYSYDANERLARVDTKDQGGNDVEAPIRYERGGNEQWYARSPTLPEVTLAPVRVGDTLEYRVPERFATELYDVRFESRSAGRVEWTRNGNRGAVVTVRAGVRSSLGRFYVRPGDVLAARGTQGASLRLTPLVAVAISATEMVVSVIQAGTGASFTAPDRKESKYTFNNDGQLIKKEVRDRNPWIPTAGAWFNAHSPEEKWLTTTYTYTTTGSTASVVSPAGSRTAYTYDDTGNVTRIDTFLNTADTTPERSTTYSFDSDGRSTGETLLGRSGTRGGVAYAYSDNARVTTYQFHTATAGGQAFQAVRERRDERRVGGVVRRTYTETYDTSGRMTQKATGSSTAAGVTTTMTYHPGTTTWQPFLPNLEGEQGGLDLAVKQYGDLVSRTSNGLQTRDYQYDAFGNPNREIIAGATDTDGSLTYANTSSTESRRTLRRYRSWNGFSQPVWDTLYEDAVSGGAAARYLERRVWTYYATGELDSSWQGKRGNTTDYTYSTSGANTGRMAGTVKGEGDGSAVTATHETVTMGYDGFGRVVTQTTDGFATTTQYDTLDRVVSTVLPNGNTTAASYHVSGTQDFALDGGEGTSGPTPPAQLEQYQRTFQRNIDALGRAAQTDVVTKDRGTRTILFTYDPFDRPIRWQNNALAMVAAGDAQATYLVYDGEGNLTKQLDPELGNTTYNDPRRPYTEFEYDAFNRKTKESKLVRSPSPVAPSAMALGGNAAAVSTWTYDAYDRVTQTTDADNWSTAKSYDPMGNLVREDRTVCTVGDTECQNNFSDEDGTNDRLATTRLAYDGAGRVIAKTDARGKTTRTRYNDLGLPSSIEDGRLVTVQVMRYTADGLPRALWEPDNDTTSTATYIGTDDYTSDPPGYVKTKRWQYASTRKYPTSMDVANMNASADTGTAYTQYQYDFAGRPTLITLPLNGTVEQTYNGRGQVIRIKDADGFVAEYQYSPWNLLEGEKKLRRPNTIDFSALPSDLSSFYEYDLAGNLTKKTQRGLVTEYTYNSGGKPKSETRPRKSGAPAETKYYTYRVDGNKTAETTFNYGGALLSSQYNSVDCSSNPPNVTAGNAQCWESSALGRANKAASYAPGGRERTQTDLYNGLGQRYRRAFDGDPGIYATYRKANGASTGAVAHATVWRFDANGNMLSSYKRATDASGNVTDAPSEASEQFDYAYSPTNKQVFRSSEVRAYNSNGTLVGRTAGASGLYTPTTGTTRPPGLATAQSVTTISYTDRDLVVAATVTDTDASGNSVTRDTGYAYYLDGTRASVTVNGVGNQSYTYDARGRLASNVDSNAQYTAANGQQTTGVTTTYTYAASGAVTETLSSGQYTSTRTPTVGGLTYETSGSAAKGLNGCTATDACPVQQTTNVYDGNGYAQTTTTLVRERQTPNTWDLGKQRVLANAYDANYNLVQITQSGYDERRSEAQGEAPTVTQASIGTQTVYEAAYSVHNTLAWFKQYNYGWSGNPSAWQQQSQLFMTYTLGSRGQRLANTVTSGAANEPFDGTTQRYDADDRSADLTRTVQLGVYNATSPASFEYSNPIRNETTDIALRYDPFGTLALTAQSRFTRYLKPLDMQTDPAYSLLEWKSSSMVELDGAVLLMHNASAMVGTRLYNPSTGVYFEPVNAYGSRDQDMTFGLQDGLVNPDGAFDAVSPFNAAPRIDAGSIPLAAPVTPLSSQVRVEPSAIQAPGASTPPLSNPGAITAPSTPGPSQAQPAASNAGVKPADAGFSSATSLGTGSAATGPASNPTTVSGQGQGISSVGVSSPSVGVQGFSVSTATTVGASPTSNATGAAPTTQNDRPQFSSQINLQPPSSVLPQTVTPLSSSSIVAPVGMGQPITPASGDVSSIQAPGSSGVPSVGATPSSGASSVQAPNGTVGNPNGAVTPPGGAGSSIAQPGSAVDGAGNVQPFDLNENQERGVKNILREIYGPAMSLESTAELNQEAVTTLTEDIEGRSRVVAEREVSTMYQGWGMTKSEAQIRANLDMREVKVYQTFTDMKPVERIEMNTDIAVGTYTGAIRPTEWEAAIEKTKEVNNGFEDCRRAWGNNKTAVSECGNSQAISFDNTTQTFKNNTFKMDNWINNQLGAESKALIENTENVASNHINRAALNYECNNVKFGLYLADSPSVVAYVGLGWGVQTNASASVGFGGPWNSADLQFSPSITNPSWSLGAGAYIGGSTISPSISNRPFGQFVGNTASFSVNVGIGPASGGLTFSASDRGEFLLNVTPPVTIVGIPANPGFGAAVNLSGTQSKCAS